MKCPSCGQDLPENGLARLRLARGGDYRAAGKAVGSLAF